MKKMEFYVGVWTKSCYGKQTNLMITRPLTTKMPPQLGNHVVSAWCINYRHFRDEKRKLGRVNFRKDFWDCY